MPIRGRLGRRGGGIKSGIEKRRSIKKCLIVRCIALRVLVSCTLAMLLYSPSRQQLQADEWQWHAKSVLESQRPQFQQTSNAQRPSSLESLIITTSEDGQAGWWEATIPIDGGAYYRFQARLRTQNIQFQRRTAYPRLLWLSDTGKPVLLDRAAIGPYHPPGEPALATPDLPREARGDADGSVWFDGVYRVPTAARRARVQLHLQWAKDARAEWSDVRLEKTAAPRPRKVRLAAIHQRPTGKSPQENCREFAPLIAQAAKERADLIVLPETLTFFGVGKSYAECAEPIPGPSTDYFGGLATNHGVHLVAGLLEREGTKVYNVAVLIGPSGKVVGKYRKVCLPRGEAHAGISPGDAYPVFDTPIGRIGMMICYDGFFPEVARNLTEAGAEIIAFPVWGCNPVLVRARACENHVYVISSTYTDVKRDWMTSAIFGHDGSTLSVAKKWGEVAVAEVDLARPTIWAGIGDFAAEMHRNRPPSALEYARAGILPNVVSSPKNTDSTAAAPPSATHHRQATSETSMRIPPMDLAAAQKAFRARDGFQMQLIAAEPLVVDPVAMVYDEWGHAYVAEMRDYPYTDKSSDKPFVERTTDAPLGRVRRLEDTDNDGSFDTSTIFAADLSWPTGLALWRGGVFVTATPDIWYLRDDDGDGVADTRRRVFTGFRKFNVQAVMNNLRWGLDHRLYAAGSSNGGRVTRDDNSAAIAVQLATNDFRWDPRSGKLEVLSGGGRFGQTFDDFGNRFICNIRNPIRHAVFPDSAIKRNQAALFAAAIHDVAVSGDTVAVYRTSAPEPWRIANATRLASDALSLSPRSEKVPAGYLTSAAGLTLYRGDAYPPGYYGQAFLGEVAGNLIHRQRLKARGVTFSSERIDERSEFITSDDNWFRPVNFVNAPDGTLHVLDMHRETIEHPWSIPDDIKQHLDLESGRDRGRIYRLAPPGFEFRPTPRLGDLGAAELTQFLTHPNAWHRDTAHRLLFERQDQSAVAPLRGLLDRKSAATNSTLDKRAAPATPPRQAAQDFDAIGRVLALWSLRGLDHLHEDDLRSALVDTAAPVRAHAVRLAAPRIRSGLRSLLLDRTSDHDARVRFQTALAIAHLSGAERDAALLAFALDGGLDRWLTAALISSAANREAWLLEQLLDHSARLDPPLAQQLAELVAVRGAAEDMTALLQSLRRAGGDGRETSLVRDAVLQGLARGAARRGKRLDSLTQSPRLQAWLRDRIASATRDAIANDLELSRRLAAVELIAQLEWSAAQPIASALLLTHEPPELQLAAARSVLRFDAAAAPALLVDRYRALGPDVRAEILQGLASRPRSAATLLDAIESGTVAWKDLSRGQKSMLLRSRSEEVKARATTLAWAQAQGEATRREVLDQYSVALDKASDLTSGEATYRRVCANCHRYRGFGVDVGPAFETVLNRSAKELLLHILDPSRDVLPSYQDYVVVMKDGTVLSGMIVEENANSITLKRAGGSTESVARELVAELVASGRSLMPEGLEKEISVEQMADLIGYLKQPRS